MDDSFNENMCAKQNVDDEHETKSVQDGLSETMRELDSRSTCAGIHLIIDFWHAEHLTDLTYIEGALRDAALAADATILHIHLHKFDGGEGVTGVALLAESHISIHTWPENNYAALDVFMCGDAQPEKSLKVLREVFKPKSIDVKNLQRGKF